MGIKKRSERIRLIRKIVILKWYLKIGKQKCLEAGYKVIKHKLLDKVKKKYKKYKNQTNINDRLLEW